MSTKYDVIIIGSGAGGGTLAHHLAPSSDDGRQDGRARYLENRSGTSQLAPEPSPGTSRSSHSMQAPFCLVGRCHDVPKERG